MIAIFIVDGILMLLFLLLVIIKTIHYYKHIRHKRLLDWFYFTRYNIILSSTSKSAHAKKKQNFYTITIGILISIILLAVYIEVLLLM